MSDENNVTPWKDRLFAETPEARRLPEDAVDEMGLYHAHAEIGELRAATAAQASAIVALKEQLASARIDALEEAAEICESRRPASREDCPEHWKAYEKSWGIRLLVANECAAAIRALASQPAAPVQPVRIEFEELRKLAMAALEHGDAIGEDDWYSCDENMSIFAPSPDLSLIAAASPATVLRLIDLAAPPVQQPVAPSKLEIWKRMRGFIITDALNDRDVTLPAHYANDLLEVFDKAMPATCTACNGTRCIAGALYDPPSECDLCADQEPPVQQHGDMGEPGITLPGQV